MIVEKMCHAVKPLVSEIHKQAFNQELSQGILPKEKFIYYLIQDALYLADFSRALAITAGRLGNNEQTQQFIQFALGAINAERSLHLNYLQEFNATKTLTSAQQNPACFMYTNYLLKTASLASVEESVAALLPCFWVYKEVGSNIARNQQANNPYNDWITLYSSDEFATSVNSAVMITNDLGNNAADSLKEKMISAFIQSTQLEWLFWNSAYHQEQWLIGEKKNVVW